MKKVIIVSLPDTFTLKKVVKTCDVEKAVRMKARKVLKPPLRTAGPMSRRVLTALSPPEPEVCEVRHEDVRLW